MWPVIGITPGQACGDRAITYRIGAQRGNWRLYIGRSLGCQGQIRRDFLETLKGVLRVWCEMSLAQFRRPESQASPILRMTKKVLTAHILVMPKQSVTTDSKEINLISNKNKGVLSNHHNLSKF